MEFSLTKKKWWMILHGWFLSVSLIRGSSSGDTTLRLVNGPGICIGRVEVFYNNVWGTVCDDNWDSQEAQVVCNQLQCGSALAGPGNARFGHGNGTIWLDNMRCQGTESLLTDCQHDTWGKSNCHHGEDASAICSEHLPKPTMFVFTSNASSELQLKCILPELYLKVKVFMIEAQSNRTLAQLSLTPTDVFAHYTINKSELSAADGYTCQYEVAAKNLSFTSPQADTVYLENTDVIVKLKAPNERTVTQTYDISYSETVTGLNEDSTPAQVIVKPLDKGLVTALSLAAALIILLLVLLCVFFVYRRKEHSPSEREPIQDNIYVPHENPRTEISSNRQLDTKKEKFQCPTMASNIPEMKPGTELETYQQPEQASHSSEYDKVICCEQKENEYEVINPDTISRDIYETLQEQ